MSPAPQITGKMGKGGRFGKYGEHKRLKRLRQKQQSPYHVKPIKKSSGRKHPKAQGSSRS